MAKSKYEFKKLKKKSLSSKIMDFTAVRVLSKAAAKLSSRWRRFVAYTGATFSNIREAAVNLDEAQRLAQKIDENNKLINTIKNDEKAAVADIKVMEKAYKENEKLNSKLSKILDKKVKIESKKAKSKGLKDALSEEAKEEVAAIEQEMETSVDALNKAFDEMGVGVRDVEATPIEATVETPEQVAKETPTVETPPAPVASNKVDTAVQDPVVGKVIEQLNKAKELAAANETLTADNQRLTSENAAKGQRVTELEEAVKNLTTERDALVTTNGELQQTNSKQAVSIANLTKENEAMKSRTADHIILEQKVSQYEGVISKHEKERADMEKELQNLRSDSSANKNRIIALELDLQKIANERDYYQSQIIALQNAMNFDPSAPTISDGRTR